GSGEIRNSYFGNASDVNGYGTYTSYTILASNEWQEITYTFTIPTDRTDFELIFSVRNTTAANGHVKVDDVICNKN
ncbi:MAG TPA: hypothetical protein VLJ60_05675, partial [bacterium]|nr:hypothetical protein [bacterium]